MPALAPVYKLNEKFNRVSEKKDFGSLLLDKLRKEDRKKVGKAVMFLIHRKTFEGARGSARERSRCQIKL